MGSYRNVKMPDALRSRYEMLGIGIPFPEFVRVSIHEVLIYEEQQHSMRITDHDQFIQSDVPEYVQ